MKYTITARSNSGFGGTYETNRKPRTKNEILKYAEADGCVRIYKDEELIDELRFTPENGGKWYRTIV